MRIIGIGLDVLCVTRMETILPDPAVTRRMFTEAEEQYIQSKGIGRFQTAAGIFAAKEAFVKALGSGFENTALFEIEVSHSETGMPFYVLRGNMAEKVRRNGILNIHLSVTHDGDISAAVCIMEGE